MMMRPSERADPGSGVPLPRVLGGGIGDGVGPTLIAIGGVHGNEPAGVLALDRVLRKLQLGPLRSGEFVALSGNRPALARRRRFIDLDLNRVWDPERVRALSGRSNGKVLAVEDVEQRELIREIEEIAARARGPVHVLDIHSISGPGRPFAVASARRERTSGLELPVPIVLGLDALVQGTLLGYLERRGFRNIAFESGQHEDPLSVDRAEAALWLSMGALGILHEDEHVEVRQSRDVLGGDFLGLPRILEMWHRHPLDADDGFRMKPGFENFQLVREGELLASDSRGEIRADRTAHILMPLYQEQGSDGFFLVRPAMGAG